MSTPQIKDNVPHNHNDEDDDSVTLFKELAGRAPQITSQQVEPEELASQILTDEDIEYIRNQHFEEEEWPVTDPEEEAEEEEEEGDEEGEEDLRVMLEVYENFRDAIEIRIRDLNEVLETVVAEREGLNRV